MHVNLRHPLILAVAVAATSCVVLSALFLVWNEYTDRPMRKSYPVKVLTSSGLTATLRTERIGNSVQYVFDAKPISDAVKERLDDVIRKRGKSLHFSVDLADDGGFELCSTTVSLHPTPDDQGKYVALTGRGVISDCPIDRYAKSKKWGLGFNYPPLADNLTPPEIVKNASPEPKSRELQSQSGTPAVTEDTLTGASVTGGIEMLSGRSFRVTREAEQMTLLVWRSSDKLTVSCIESSCVIKDDENGQSVHARLLR